MVAGYSSEEKMKILYEDSLKDIREISAQIAAVTARIEAANAPNTLLAGISKEVTLLIDLEKSLVKSKDALLGTINQAKEIHEAHIADLLEASIKQMDAVSAERLDAFVKDAVANFQTVVADIIKNAQEVKTKIVQDVGDEAVRIVRDRVAKEDTSLSAASAAYTRLTADFEKAMVQRHKDAADAVKTFGEALQNTIKEHAPMGLLGQVVWLFVSSAVGGGAIILSVHFGWLELPQTPLTAAQQAQIADGLFIEKVWPKLTDKEKANLQGRAKQE